MSNWHSIVGHVSHGTYMTFWHCETAITLKTVPSKERKIFCHLCNKQHGFMLWKTCIDVITIVKFISEHSVYMNLLYMRIFTRNKLKRAIKHICVTYFCILHICITHTKTMSCSTPFLHDMAGDGREGCTSHMGTSASFHISNWNGVVGFVTLGSIRRGCTSHLGTHALFHMSNWHGVVGLFMSASLSMVKWHDVLILECWWFGVVVFQRSIVIWGRLHLP